MIGSLVATGRKRSFSPPGRRLLILASAAFAVWVIYANLFAITDPLLLGILFVCGAYALLFVAIGATPRAPDRVPVHDVVLSVLALACGAYFLHQAEAITYRISLLERLTPPQLTFGSLLLALTLEATRRSAGAGLTAIVMLFLAYNLFGAHLPPPYGHGVTEYGYFLDVLVFTTDGLFGVPIQVVASYVFLFVMFGTFLGLTGGSDFFLDLARLLTGRSRGGPAKVAVVSSGLYGTISGSPTSDVVATGTITIPAMRRLGYPARFAGAVEVAASTGGSAMPPIMGSAAFILAEYTGLAYRQVIAAALVPALLYYVGVFAQVHLRAVRLDLRAGDASERADAPASARAVLRGGRLYLLPVLVLLGALLAGYSPGFTAGLGTAALIGSAALSPSARLGLRAILRGLGETTLRILPVAGACAAAGLVIGGLSMTGLGMKAAGMILLLGDGTAPVTLLIAALVTLILGLGMPTPSAYVLAAALVAPALERLGYPLLQSHMFLLYFAILSAATPPIAVAALAASTIAEEDPFAIALAAMRLAAVGFVLPFAFVWNPALLLQGTPLAIALALAGGIAGAIALAVAVEGPSARAAPAGGRSSRAWQRPLNALPRPVPRLLLPVAAAAAVAPQPAVALAGMAAILGLIWPRIGGAVPRRDV
ncbi:TRAP transporter permease [Brevirhabdus sp.]|uniref:TRAP transporter permease n=1 Tax=Brevirhabdus sp. TaxID=2004514 RepID=UPI0040581EAB